MRPWLLVSALCLSTSDLLAASHAVPVEFVDHRVFLVAKEADGSTLRFYTDSGGGWNAVSAGTAKRLALKSLGDIDGDEGKAHVVAYPPSLLAAGVPTPVDTAVFNGGLIVDDAGQLTEDGFLGNRWFDGRAWIFDYRAGTLSWADDYAAEPDDRRVDLHFPAAQGTQGRIAFARIVFQVDGESHDALLDTGATITLTDTSAPLLARPAGTAIGGSFIIRSVFDRWHAAHPDWRVIDKADLVHGHAARMIEVPRLEFGGVEVGPVWFAERPDPAFRKYMAGMMDKPTDGALGGSAFRNLRLVIDYPKAVAWVRKE